MAGRTSPPSEDRASGTSPQRSVSSGLAGFHLDEAPTEPQRIAPPARGTAATAQPSDPKLRARLRAVSGGAAGLLNVRRFAELLGVSTATVYHLVERGELAHVRVSNAIRVSPADLAAYLEHQRGGAR